MIFILAIGNSAVSQINGITAAGESEDALLQIDDEERGLRIKRSYCHGVLPLVIWTVACP